MVNYRDLQNLIANVLKKQQVTTSFSNGKIKYGNTEIIIPSGNTKTNNTSLSKK